MITAKLCRLAPFSLLLLLLSCSYGAHAADGRFVSDVVARWLPNGRDMELTQAFTYIDGTGKSWTVPQGSIVDGASIPRVLWTAVGAPFTGKYRKSSVAHDYFCQTMTRGWQEVHRMFFDASLVEGNDVHSSKLMYAAVYAWGPRWDNIGGKPVRTRDSPKNPSETEFQSLAQWIKDANPTLQEIAAYTQRTFPRTMPLAENRAALVIGNSAYQFAPKLPNPRNDATDIADALKGLGYEVVLGVDLDKGGMDRTIRDFARLLKGADAGIFFYAGHGIQVSGHNYLVPTDAKLEDASGLDFEMVRLDLVHRSMERETSTNIIFLDACRDNPLARNLARALGTRSVEVRRGLAAVESGSGTLIAFSTQPGNVALDGAGRNSPFTEALVKRFKGEPSKEDLSRMLIGVRNEVMAATKNKQVPWENSALTRPYYISTPPLLSSPSSPNRPFEPKYDKEMELAFWNSVKDARSSRFVQDYLNRYPDGHFASLARSLIDHLNKEEEARASMVKKEAEAKAAEEAAKAATARQQLEQKRAEEAKRAQEIGKAQAELQKAREALERAKAEKEAAVLAAKQARDDAEKAKAAQATVRKEAEAQANEMSQRPQVKKPAQEEQKKAPGAATEPQQRGQVALISPLVDVPPAAKAPQPGGNPRKQEKAPDDCDGIWVSAEVRVCIKPGSGQTFKDCRDCPEMVVVPPGEFLMGSEDGESNEKPVRKVTLAAPFAVGKFEVTFAEWDTCVRAGGCTHSPDDKGWGRERRPVVDVSWDHTTKEYLPWLSTQSGKAYRLLSEAEWEFAARAQTQTPFPWGTVVGKDRASCKECAAEPVRRTVPVGSFPPNKYGIHDMHGNVYEQTQDCWNKNYQGAPVDGSAWLTGDCKRRVIRGGSWFTPAKYLRSPARDADAVTYRNSNVGFRVARSL